MKRILAFLFVLLVLYKAEPSTKHQGIYFDDADPNLARLGNGDFYEIAFRKSNGALAYITDKTTGQPITLGSRYECLWGAVFPEGNPDYVGGCNFNASWPNRFTYSWNPITHTLTLDFTPDPSATQQVTAQVVVMASEEPWFDMRLTLQNNWGARLDYVLFPSDMVFEETEIEEALLPILPGVVLEPGFFQENRSYTTNYPGYPGVFADFVHLASTNGQLALYSLYGDGPIHPLVMGFIHDDAYVSDSTYYYHTFGAGVDDAQTWTTPTVRLRISQTALDTIQAYREENGLHTFASLAEKLGGLIAQVTQAPLYKGDAAQLARPFSQYGAMLAEVPVPGIFHPVAYQKNGHDEQYPDFLPPDPAWGTEADFEAMVQEAQALGFLAMPYTNPTWWDDESPTLQNLPAGMTISDVAALDHAGSPVYEYYGSHGGYVMSPYAPFVQQRLDQLVTSMTVEIPSDLLFEDQIGARPWLFDQNPAAPNRMAYIEGWLAHTRAYSDTLLMTELGFDRLAETEVGFHGSILLPERTGATASWWGTDTWHPYPLAPLMVRDKVLFYQHDLAPETFTFDKATFTWNLAFGYMLSYDLVASNFGGGLESGWLGLVATFQKQVLARYAQERVTDFAYLTETLTQTTFEAFTVTANWDQENSVNVDDNVLPPMGVQVSDAEGTLTAGVFTHYNGVSLSPGDHYLIEARGLHEIMVYQPVGAMTTLTLDRLPTWQIGAPVEAWAFSATDHLLGRLPVVLTSQNVTLAYQVQVAGQTVAYYKIFVPAQVSLPLVLK